MAKFGEFCYGNGTLFGDGQPAQDCATWHGHYLWILEIAWSGSFSGTNEAEGRMIAPVSLRRGKKAYINNQGSGLEPIYTGELTLTLDNHDGRYDPYQTGSVLYGRTPQGMDMRLSVAPLVGGRPGTIYRVFTGYVQNIVPTSRQERVTVTCVDDIQTLQNLDITIPMQFSSNVSAAVDAVLDQAGLGNRSVGSHNHPLTLFSLNNQNAMQVINDLSSASLGQFFITAGGRATFYPLNYDSMPAFDIDQSEVLKEFSIAQPWDTKRTHIRIAANRWVRTAVKTLWQTSQDIALLSGQTKTFDITFSGICEPVQLDPYAGDYSLVGLGYLGGGRWINAYITNITASGCTVVMTNSGPFPTSTYIRVRGREYVQSYPESSRGYVPWQTYVPAPTRTISTKVICTAGSDSVPPRNRSFYASDNLYSQDANFAQHYADILKSHLENGSKNPVITLQTYLPEPDKMFGIDLLDKIHFTSAAKNIDATYYLGMIEMQWLNDNGQDVSVTYSMINRLYNADSITPEGITEIGDEDPGDDDDGGGLPPPTGGPCYYGEPPNGPFGLQGAGQTYYNHAGANVIASPFPARARGAITHQHPTTVNINGTCEGTADGITWVPSTWPNITVKLLNAESVIASSVLTNRQATFRFVGVEPMTSVYAEIPTGQGVVIGHEDTGDPDDYLYSDQGWTILPTSNYGGDPVTIVLSGHDDTNKGYFTVLELDIGFIPTTSTHTYWRVGSHGISYIYTQWSENGTDWNTDFIGSYAINTGGGFITIDRPVYNRYIRMVNYDGNAPPFFAWAALNGVKPIYGPNVRLNVSSFTISNVC